MPGLPSGTVTFLFTDVEGSTRLWSADSDAMSASLRVHDEILRRGIEGRGGYVFTTAGDAFCAAFSRASDATECAVAVQNELAGTSWPGPELRVRMGLHLGEAEERGGDYFGPVVNTAARVESAASGGQVLITRTVRDSASVDVADLGEHRLRDVDGPLRLFQLGEGDFGSMRGVDIGRDSLPRRRTRLIGREREARTVTETVTNNWLVTIVGPGGMGKTSLAVEVAGELEVPGGAHFVDLATVSDGSDVIAAVCSALRLQAGAVPIDDVVRFLGHGDHLLVVDNCEHVIDDAAAVIDELLGRTPGLRVLATSREALELDGERVIQLGPLEGDGNAPSRLFVERCVAANPAFNPTAEDFELIERICDRLDAMPLAIELAAASGGSMSMRELHDALDQRFEVLTGRGRGRQSRHQTLRAAIEWSVELCDTREVDALARLSVFVAGFDLEDAAHMVGASRVSAMDIVSSLAAKSLVQRVEDHRDRSRYRLLESVRQWGRGWLEGEGLMEVAVDRHAERFAELASRSDPIGTTSIDHLRRGEVALPDIIAAARHLATTDPVAAGYIVGPFAAAMSTAGLAGEGLDLIERARIASDASRGSPSSLGRTRMRPAHSCSTEPTTTPHPMTVRRSGDSSLGRPTDQRRGSWAGDECGIRRRPPSPQRNNVDGPRLTIR